MLDDEKNKAVEKTGFRVWGMSQKVSLRRRFLSEVLSKTWSQGGERKREVKSENSEKESFKFFFPISYSFKKSQAGHHFITLLLLLFITITGHPFFTYFIETFLKSYLFSW